MQQEKEKEMAAMKRRHKHAQEVRKQVKVKEDEKVSARRAFFEEGIKLDHEAKERSVIERDNIAYSPLWEVLNVIYIHTLSSNGCVHCTE